MSSCEKQDTGIYGRGRKGMLRNRRGRYEEREAKEKGAQQLDASTNPFPSVHAVEESPKTPKI